MKIELTIKTDYLPTWGAWEGIRELVQNARDAEVEFRAPMTITHQGQTLRIENEGCTLPHEALLLGHTSKSDRSDLIGQYGEGLKLGILALVRAERPVKIRSGSEVWIPTIVRSEKFNADVLAMDISSGREPKNRVRIEIGGVTEVEWVALKERFLFLRRARKSIINTAHGDLLTDEDDVGKVFVKGIYVQKDLSLHAGYNFPNCNVDRDRKMVNSWDLQYYAQQIWRVAAGMSPDLFGRFVGMLKTGADDVRAVDPTYMNPDLVQQVADNFIETHGVGAVPVENYGESAELEHWGRHGVVVPKPLAQLLRSKLGSLEAVKAASAQEAIRSYGSCDLEPEELGNLERAQALLAASGVAFEGVLEVVDFRSDLLQGQYCSSTVRVARKVLADLVSTLKVLLHEICHAHGTDGEKGHVAAIEDAWSRVARHLLEERC